MNRILLITFSLLASCSFEKAPKPVIEGDQTRISKAYAEIEKYPTGKAVMEKIRALQNNGVSITTQLQRATDMRAMGTDSVTEGYIENTNGKYNVMLSEELDLSTMAHALTHELVHVLDDHDTDEALRSHTDYQTNIQYTVQRMQAGETDQLNQSQVSYVLASVFCAEARAYTANQRLLEEGLMNSKMQEVTSQLATHIDSTYIQRFNTSYGANKQAMLEWCLSMSSMLVIQNSLITTYLN